MSKITIFNPRYFSLKFCLSALSKVKGKILDVGCGAGIMAKEIRNIRPDLKLYGLDTNSLALNLARQESKGVVFLKGSVYHLPFPDNYFDATFNHHLFEHLDSPQKAMEETARVTKRGGRIYFCCPLEGNWSSLQTLFYKIPSYKKIRIKYTGHVQQFTFDEILELFKINGFTVKDYRWTGFILSQVTNILYYPLANLIGLSPAFLTENDLLKKKKSWYSYLGTLVKRFGYFIINLESLLITKIPQEEIHLVGEKR